MERHSGSKINDLLPVIRKQADLYEQWTLSAAAHSGNLSAVEMAVYRMQASSIELLKPLLIWLHEPGRNIPAEVIDDVVRDAESWVIRRQLLRLTTSDLGRIVADLIKTLAGAPVSELGDRVTAHLARLNVASTYWPGDGEIRLALASENAYRRYPRARLRMFLEAIENHYRAETGQPQVERVGYPIEHILPRRWQENWPVDDPEKEQDRHDHVHRFGNLTMLTANLNNRVSNGPWGQKRTALLQHNTIKLTGRLLAVEGTWDEEAIESRTSEMIDALLSVWPTPSGHEGKIVDPQTKSEAQNWVELKHLLEGGYLTAGERLVATHYQFEGREAEVTADGGLRVEGRRFSSPSGAAKHLRQGPTNGWYFWALLDGRRLRDVKNDFLAAKPKGV